ncbi:MAG: hypothetical protein ACT4NL_11670 [Pseudomarimonas sp.]
MPRLATITGRGFYSDDFFFLQRARDLGLSESLIDTWSIYGGLRVIGYALMTVQYEILGDSALLHQLLLLSLHVLCTGLLYRFLDEAFGARLPAWVGAACFAVMPWNLQTGIWAVCGLNLVAAALILLSARMVWQALQSADIDRSRLGFATGIFFVAVLCYEQYLAWIAVWPLLAITASPQRSIAHALRSAVPLMFAALLAAAFITQFAADSERQANPIFEPVTIVLGTISRIEKALLNHVWLGLSGARSYHLPVIQSWLHSNPFALFALAISVICVGLGLRSAMVAHVEVRAAVPAVNLQRHRAWFAMLAGSMILLPIVIMAMAAGNVIEQRAMYPVSIGFAFALAWLTHELTMCGRLSRRMGLGLAAGIGIGLIVLAVSTATRSAGWVEAWQHSNALIQVLKENEESLSSGSVVVVDGFPDTLPGSVLVTGNDHGLRNLGRWALNGRDVTLVRRRVGHNAAEAAPVAPVKAQTFIIEYRVASKSATFSPFEPRHQAADAGESG